MTKTIVHESTKTSRDVRAIEMKLAGKLHMLARTIRKDPFYPHNMTGLRQKYDTAVRSAVQSAVQKTYMKGMDYVADYEGIPTLLTGRDLQNIQQKASQQVDGFWRAVTRDTINVQVPEVTRKVNIQATTSLLATAAVTSTLALATVDKVQQLGDNETEVTWITSLDEKVCPICRPIHRRTWKLNDPTLLHPIEDSHPNCRCRLLLKDGREIYSH